MEGERGITIPRLNDLLEAGERRRYNERVDLANMLAAAFNEPKKLDEVLRPPKGDPSMRQNGGVSGGAQGFDDDWEWQTA